MIRAIRDTGWVGGSIATRQLLGMLGIVAASRMLGTQEFASYLVAQTIGVILIPLMDIGAWTLVTRLAARPPERPALSIAGASIMMRRWYWLGMLATVGPVLVLTDSSTATLYMCALVGALGQATVDAICGEWLGRRQYARSAGLRAGVSLLALILLAALLSIAPTAVVAMLAFVAARTLPPLVLWLKVRPRVEAVRGLTWGPSLRLGLATIVQIMYVRVDLLMLAAYDVQSRYVALYGVAYSVLLGLQFVPAAIAAVTYPRVAAARTETWQVTVRLALGLTIVATLICLASLLVLLTPIFSLFGSQYAEDAPRLTVLLMASLPMAISLVTISSLQARDREAAVLRLMGLVLVINVSGNAVLIPLLGFVGAAVATLGAETVCAAGALMIAGRACVRRKDAVLLACTGGGVAATALVGGTSTVIVGLTLGAALCLLFDIFDIRRVGMATLRGLPVRQGLAPNLPT